MQLKVGAAGEGTEKSQGVYEPVAAASEEATAESEFKSELWGSLGVSKLGEQKCGDAVTSISIKNQSLTSYDWSQP
jgi:hypothetical protein